MGSRKNNILSVPLSEELAKKFAFICRDEGISTKNAVTFLIRQKISYFERVKGKISPKDMSTVQLDDFDEE